MKKFIFITCLLFACWGSKAQFVDSIIVHYYENYPYAYMEGGKLKGIEIEIIESYVSWLQSKKGTSVMVLFKPFSEFSTFYNSVKNGGPNVIGLGSVTMNPEREKDVTLSPAYLRNVAVLITDGKVPTIKARAAAEVSNTLGSLSAITVNGSSHASYLEGIKRTELPELKIEISESQTKVLEKIVSNSSFFGYVDIIAYWAFLKNNPSKFLKIQKVFNEPKEYLGFIMPKKTNHQSSVYEFFERGFGFTSTKAYRQILERYLGYEIIESVEIK